MVAGDDDLLSVREGVEPVELGLDLRDGAGVAEVARVDEDVAGRDGGGCVGVGVGEADEADTVGACGVVGRAAEEEDEGVDVAGEEFEGGGEEGGEEGWWLEGGGRGCREEGHYCVGGRTEGCIGCGDRVGASMVIVFTLVFICGITREILRKSSLLVRAWHRACAVTSDR